MIESEGPFQSVRGVPARREIATSVIDQYVQAHMVVVDPFRQVTDVCLSGKVGNLAGDSFVAAVAPDLFDHSRSFFGVAADNDNLGPPACQLQRGDPSNPMGVVRIASIKGDRVRLAFSFPREIEVHRREVADQILETKPAVVGSIRPAQGGSGS